MANVKDPVKRRAYNLKYLYGITLQEYDELLSKQGGTCATCPVLGTSENLMVDHDHSCCPGIRSCGKCIRGLLCRSCNMVLGKVGDNPDTLMRMVDYLNS